MLAWLLLCTTARGYTETLKGDAGTRTAKRSSAFRTGEATLKLQAALGRATRLPALWLLLLLHALLRRLQVCQYFLAADL